MIVAHSRSVRPIEEEWEGDEGTLVVGYGLDGTVGATSFRDAAPYTPGLLELAHWRLGRLRSRLLP